VAQHLPTKGGVEAVIFWCGVNAIIGYLIGKAKNEVGGAIVLSILLGPIGWLIAALSRGHLRKCPFCAEQVKPEATVCKHCGSKLPPAYDRIRDDHPQIGSRPKANQKPTTEAATGGGRKSKAVTVIGVIIMLAILAIAVLRYYKNRDTDVASSNLEEVADKAHAHHSSSASDTPTPTPQPELRGMSVMRLVRIKTPDGELIIPKGTPVRVINEESSPGTTLINYDGYTVPVPSAILGPVPN
jgi:hypothetical protein